MLAKEADGGPRGGFDDPAVAEESFPDDPEVRAEDEGEPRVL